VHVPDVDDRSEETLRLDLEKQRQLLESIDVIVWKMVPATLKVTYVTGALSRLGYGAATWTGRQDFFEQLLCPAERDVTLALVRAAAADGKERRCVHRVVAADGGERWFRTCVRRSVTERGLPELLGVMLDVTDRVATEARIHDDEAHLQRLLEQLPALVWTTDRELRFTSGAGRELVALGLPSTTVLMGVPIEEYLQVSDPDAPMLVSCRRALAGEPVSVETEWMGRAYQTHIEPFRDAQGEIVGVLAVSWNVTERKRAEDNLRLLAAASATLAASLDYDETLGKVARLAVGRLADWCIVGVVEGETLRPVAAAHVDPSKQPLFAGIGPVHVGALGDLARSMNEKASLLFADVPDSMIAPGTALPLPSGEMGERTAEALRRIGLRSLLIVPLVARKQRLGTLAFGRAAPRSAFTGADQRVAEDLANRCAMAIDSALLYGTAKAAIEARDDFLSVASHELRTPLTSILLRLEAIERGIGIGRKADLTDPQGPLGVVLRQCKRLSGLVDQLLDVSRIRRGSLDLELEDVDLGEVLRDVSARLDADIARAGSSLSLSAAAVTGRWDRARVEQVITNLLSNAIKFARGTAIEAVVETTEARARLVVRDGGMGISAADQKRIFGRFERAASSRHFGGLGLGLYITRQIVNAHGGTIHLQSAPGEGTVVTVELPRWPDGSTLA
jgi:signal transduction histidine kinase/PAS domain-containing protein